MNPALLDPAQESRLLSSPHVGGMGVAGVLGLDPNMSNSQPRSNFTIPIPRYFTVCVGERENKFTRRESKLKAELVDALVVFCVILLSTCYQNNGSHF